VQALVLVVLSQVFVWTDSRGEQHFTDDRSSIPRGAKVRTTDGAELSVVSSGLDRGDAGLERRDAGLDRRDAGLAATKQVEVPDTCSRARERVTQLEGKLGEAKKKAEQARLAWNGDCQSVLNLHGQAAFAQCMAAGGSRSRRAPQPPETATFTAPIEAELEQARDTLRRAQVAGCR
jgi:hypothetical protein